MKKIQCLLLILCLTFGFSSKTNAQLTEDVTQTGVVIGSIHTYDVTDHSGSTFSWSVVDATDTDITAGAGTYEITDTPNGFTRSIKWNADGTYYLKVVETVTSTSCNNFYVVKVIVIADSYSVQFVSIATPSNSVYCADDSALGSPEITLDIQLGAAIPDNSYYPMNVFYTLGTDPAELTATVTNTNNFNLGAVDIGTATAPNTTSVKLTLLRVVDANGVIFNPADADKEFNITINPIPVKPVINF